MGKKMQQLVAAVDGTVVVLRHETSGNSLYLRGDDGWYYAYLHINNDTPGTDDGANRFAQAFAPGLAVGSRVRKGQLVAYMGDSGNAEGTAPHLHFEIRMPNANVWNASAVNAAPSLRAAADPSAFPAPPANAFEPWDSALPFIAQQTEDVLDRPISAQGLPVWLVRLVSGEVTADEAIQQLLAMPESLDPMGSVSRLWLAAYDRMPDRNLIIWARRLRAGGSLATQAAAYLARPELQTRFGGTDAQFATTVLMRVLGRAPTAAEIDDALVWTRAGASRAELLVVLSQSDAAKMALQHEMLLTMVFEAMLRRGPTASTYTTWLERLQRPEGYANLIRTIRTGAAYADRF
jgi:murein DD-endopeptidase MepM/ murein hydrolase activator NlpD